MGHSDIMASPKIIFTVLTFAFSLHWASGSNSPNMSNDQLSEKLKSLEAVILELAAGQEELVASQEELAAGQEDIKTKFAGLDSNVKDNSKALELYHIGFSCHRDTSSSDGSDGVITYTGCDINEFNIMSPSTGKATITRAGEYFIPFFADLVSEYGWAYCTLFQKSGTSLIELGSINNELQNVFSGEALSSSSSMSVIAKLRQGDELYVVLDVSGSSHFFADQYRRVSFTAFLIKDIL